MVDSSSVWTILPRIAAVLCALAPCLAEPQTSPFRFVNQSQNAGISVQMRHGGPAKRWIAEANGSGVAALDYDGDGWLDLAIVNGSTMGHLRRIKSGQTAVVDGRRLHLYRNGGNGRFVDVTEASGLDCPYWGTGANAADFDNDGDPDILVTTIGLDLLFENNGDGTFSEIGKKAGLSRKTAWHTGSAFGDYDRDGDLDLYIAGYVSLHALPIDEDPPVCRYRGLDAFCGPQGLAGEPDLLYRNDGGTFTDVTSQAGVALSVPRHGFSVVFEDLSGDGQVDLFVSNDSDPNLLFVNRGDHTFREEALASGLAYNAYGGTQADMGVALGDYDSDGDLDLFTTTFSEDYFPLFEQKSPGIFEDVSQKTGLSALTVPFLGWGCGFSDFDNDGDKDLWMANGHVYPTIDDRGSSSYFQPLVVLENRHGQFELSEGSIDDLTEGSYRSGLQGDFDNDGRIDLLVLPIDGSPVLLANRSPGNNSWIGLRLVGTGGNRDALGSRVDLEFCGQQRFDTVRNGGSYLSRSDPRIHFGLGQCKQVDRATVRWPGGTLQTFSDLKVNEWATLQQEPR